MPELNQFCTTWKFYLKIPKLLMLGLFYLEFKEDSETVLLMWKDSFNPLSATRKITKQRVLLLVTQEQFTKIN